MWFLYFWIKKGIYSERASQFMANSSWEVYKIKGHIMTITNALFQFILHSVGSFS